MAQNLQQLKRRIKTAKNIAQIAKAMEMIAASKIKRAQNMVATNKPYAKAIIEHTQAILEKSKDKQLSHPYLSTSNSSHKMLIIISPDKGLCGPLVTNLIRDLSKRDLKDTYVISVGKKIERYAARFEGKLIASFPMGTSLPSYSAVFPLIKIIDEYVELNKVSQVEILYPQFTSIFTQTPALYQLLPITQSEKNETLTSEREYLFEPSAQVLLDTLLPYYIEVSLYNYFLESYTSEQAARMIAMQNAKNNAKDIADSLALTYNKSRQEKITNELLDLTNGQTVSG